MLEFKLSATPLGDDAVYCQKCCIFVGTGNFRYLISIHLEKEHSFT
ncbi:hypothetical protein LCGC14_0444130 [marine sediment metagenome]|uniref:Uncharacterized protein n=1 Tax=marine sediment metagenome TaxID=412755 RepID=A0A0F9SQC6_9ZZZZ